MKHCKIAANVCDLCTFLRKGQMSIMCSDAIDWKLKFIFLDDCETHNFLHRLELLKGCTDLCTSYANLSSFESSIYLAFQIQKFCSAVFATSFTLFLQEPDQLNQAITDLQGEKKEKKICHGTLVHDFTTLKLCLFYKQERAWRDVSSIALSTSLPNSQELGPGVGRLACPTSSTNISLSHPWTCFSLVLAQLHKLGIKGS